MAKTLTYEPPVIKGLTVCWKIVKNDKHKMYSYAIWVGRLRIWRGLLQRIVRWTQDSKIIIHEPIACEYFTDCWTEKPSEHFPLMVFKTYKDALQFYSGRANQQRDSIYLAVCIPDDSIYVKKYELSIWYAMVDVFYSARKVPSGTMLASRVLLLNEEKLQQ